MSTMHLRKLVLLSIVVLAVILAGCTRSASTPPPATEPGGQSIEDSQRATMDAVKAALLTQTVQPEITELPTYTSTPPLPSSTPSPQGPTDTPVVVFDTSTPSGGGQEQTHIVQAGDSVSSIASAFGVSPDEIIAWNNLQYPYYLDVGQELIIPASGSSSGGATNTPPAGAQEYVVQQGEWIYSIARKFGVSPDAIIEANGLPYPYTVYPGDVLHIP